jgi:hypothetical protein
MMLLGALLARLTWSGPLLRVDRPRSQVVDPWPTAEEQFINAMLSKSADMEQALLSVEKYHPPAASPENQYYYRRSLVQLGALHLDRQQWDRAYEAYLKLSNVEPAEREFRAIGLAGLAIVHNERNEIEAMRDKLTKVWPDRSELDANLQGQLTAILQQREIRLRETGAGPGRLND